MFYGYALQQLSAIRLRGHINEFHCTGGYLEEILAVIKRLLKQEESTLNRQLEDFAGFYEFKPVLCRAYRGQSKGEIERTV